MLCALCGMYMPNHTSTVLQSK